MKKKKTKDLIEVEINMYVAKDVGLKEAILYENIKFWCDTNQKSNKYFRDGYYWTFASKRKLAELFTFWTERRIATMIKNLVRKEYIVLRNFNKDKFDKTKWYRINKKIIPNGDMFIVPKINLKIT